MVTAEGLAEILKKNPSAGWQLLAAAKLDDDYKKNLLPTDFKDWNSANPNFNEMDNSNYSAINLPPFIKAELIRIIATEHRKQ
jgi:hypothetical protein